MSFRIYNVHNILLQVEVETDEEDNVVVLDEDNNGDDELVDMASVGGGARPLGRQLTHGPCWWGCYETRVLQPVSYNYGGVQDGQWCIPQACHWGYTLQILGKILSDIYITASKQTMLAKDKPMGDSDDDNDDYDYSDDNDDDDDDD